MFKRLVAILVCLTFSLSNVQYIHAQDFSINQLPVPGTMVGESIPFAPLALKGLIVNLQKPLEFQFIVDTGKGAQDTASIKEGSNQLVKYFLAGLTIPENELWVNLSPYEKDRMVPMALGQTDLGRDLLAQDYILKQLTASLIYPEKDLGKEFWSRVYTKAQKQFGTTNIAVNTFNKVWILPNEAQVFESGSAAYVTKSSLKVMLDEDYLSLTRHSERSEESKEGMHNVASQVVRDIVIPEITKEVNTGKNFAPLRQIYQALILAKWYKETIQNALLDALYTNKNKVAGVNLNDPSVKEQIYNRYLQAYKKGVFNYIKEDPTSDGQVMPRKYFSGGTRMIIQVDKKGTEQEVEGQKPDGAMTVITIGLIAAGALIAGGLALKSSIQKANQKKIEEEGRLADEGYKLRLEKLRQTEPELYNRLALELSKINRTVNLETFFSEALKFEREGYDFEIIYEPEETFEMPGGYEWGDVEERPSRTVVSKYEVLRIERGKLLSVDDLARLMEVAEQRIDYEGYNHFSDLLHRQDKDRGEYLYSYVVIREATVHIDDGYRSDGAGGFGIVDHLVGMKTEVPAEFGWKKFLRSDSAKPQTPDKDVVMNADELAQKMEEEEQRMNYKEYNHFSDALHELNDLRGKYIYVYQEAAGPMVPDPHDQGPYFEPYRATLPFVPAHPAHWKKKERSDAAMNADDEGISQPPSRNGNFDGEIVGNYRWIETKSAEGFYSKYLPAEPSHPAMPDPDAEWMETSAEGYWTANGWQPGDGNPWASFVPIPLLANTSSSYSQEVMNWVHNNPVLSITGVVASTVVAVTMAWNWWLRNTIKGNLWRLKNLELKLKHTNSTITSPPEYIDYYGTGSPSEVAGTGGEVFDNPEYTRLKQEIASIRAKLSLPDKDAAMFSFWRSPKYKTLSEAIRSGNLKATRKFLEEGADPNSPDPGDTGGYPIFYSLHHGPEMIQLLIDHKVNLNILGRAGITPLALSRALGLTDVVNVLEKAGAQYVTNDYKYWMDPVHYFQFERQLSEIVFLARMNFPTESGIEIAQKVKSKINFDFSPGTPPLEKEILSEENWLLILHAVGGDSLVASYEATKKPFVPKLLSWETLNRPIRIQKDFFNQIAPSIERRVRIALTRVPTAKPKEVADLIFTRLNVHFPSNMPIALQNQVKQELRVFALLLMGEEKVDQAALARDLGGIDFNQINVLRNGKTINVQFDQAQLSALEQGGFEGFTPVIISIRSIKSPLPLLGVSIK